MDVLWPTVFSDARYRWWGKFENGPPVGQIAISFLCLVFVFMPLLQRCTMFLYYFPVQQTTYRIGNRVYCIITGYGWGPIDVKSHTHKACGRILSVIDHRPPGAPGLRVHRRRLASASVSLLLGAGHHGLFCHHNRIPTLKIITPSTLQISVLYDRPSKHGILEFSPSWHFKTLITSTK